MFAVEGWDLGKIVTHTALKKKLKRKRNEKEETTCKAEALENRVRENPFSIGYSIQQSTKPIPQKKQKKSNKIVNMELKKDTDEGEKIPDFPAKPAISMRQAARDRAAKKAARKLLHTDANAENTPECNISLQVPKTEESANLSVQPILTPLQQKMRAKLAGSQFRHINEKLYTTHSSKALNLFTEQPSLFHDYHQGFRYQVQSWPINPIDKFIQLLSDRLKSKLIVADLGCGDAALARHFHKTKGIKIRSFDLVKVNEFIEVSDIANVPLSDQSVDIAVFCLSLMGTNFLGFIREACRYTKLHGEIWIAEIKSRFVDPTFKTFIGRLATMGLKLLEKDEENKMFVVMRFEKFEEMREDSGLKEEKLLKACLYKKR